MLWLLDRTAQLTDLKRETPSLEPLACGAALKTAALAATLLFVHGQTTERTIIAAERLGRALGVTVRVLPYWGAQVCGAFVGAKLAEVAQITVFGFWRTLISASIGAVIILFAWRMIRGSK